MTRSEPGASLGARYTYVRSASLALCRSLTPEDACAQSMPDASPAKWHLAHTTWFFETFLLVDRVEGYRSRAPAFRELFNSYYTSVGAAFPRAQRGLLTRPSFDEIVDFRRAVDERMARWLAAGALDPAAASLVELGIAHEQQHQELLLTDVKHLLSLNPIGVAYRTDLRMPRRGVAPAPLRWCRYDGGVVEIGHEGAGFAFDNEGPRHRIFLAPYELASRPVSNREFLAFIDDGGYRTPGAWMSDGWDWLRASGATRPIYWRDGPEGPLEYTLGGLRPLDLDAPAGHLNWYEADAYARWAAARLPTEAEWEHAAAMTCATRAGAVPTGINDLGSDRLQPCAAPESTATAAPQQLFGDVWEWTASPYAPYPGFRPGSGAVGEYNGKFMCNQFVLRGGSCVTPPGHLRPTYRNFFGPDKRWQFSGLRLARDAT